MPVIRTARQKKPPDGFEQIEPILDSFEEKLRTSKVDLKNIQSTAELNHHIFQIHHQRSRYIFDLYWHRKLISKTLYEWLLLNKYGDANLIAKWKKKGYEKLCCLRCISKTETNFGSTCICRVPRNKLADKSLNKGCISCGCFGCASTD